MWENRGIEREWKKKREREKEGEKEIERGKKR